MSYTKGPWLWVEDWLVTEDGTVIVCGDDPRGNLYVEDDDARLIAAAPALLEAAQEVIGAGGWPERIEAITTLRAAVAEALGEGD